MSSVFISFFSITTLFLQQINRDQNFLNQLLNTKKKYSLDTSNVLKVSMPINRIVYQRDRHNKANIRIVGSVTEPVEIIEARLISRKPNQGESTGWICIAKDVKAGSYSGLLKGTGGWYDLQVRAGKRSHFSHSIMIERVGIGEVFVIAGHSVAQGGEINIDGAIDERVSTVPLDEKTESFEQYLKTGDPEFLPAPEFVQAATGVAPAPFGHNNYFWSKFAELLVQKENVPVLIYNAAFGGTNLEHWAKSSAGIQFEHGFVKSGIRMPYINLVNTFKKYIPLTGLRALLIDHGQNDAGEKNADKILANYKILVDQARRDLGFDELAIVVNRQTPTNAPAVRIAQDEMIREPYAFAGPDYDKLLPEDRVDGVHLSASGEENAAIMWADALSSKFFKNAIPYQPGFNEK